MWFVCVTSVFMHLFSCDCALMCFWVYVLMCNWVFSEFTYTWMRLFVCICVHFVYICTWDWILKHSHIGVLSRCQWISVTLFECACEDMLVCIYSHLLCFLYQVCADGSLYVHVYKLIWLHVFGHMCDCGYMNVHAFVNVYMCVCKCMYVFCIGDWIYVCPFVSMSELGCAFRLIFMCVCVCCVPMWVCSSVHETIYE